ncbi:peptidase S41 family protein ustP [Colletotrichum spaethianum]|uniref:Peptidase S41 family protein ustP n=1 Tax=Colletotrichum spaethianum TaxID=700344 RepID=A0AA37PCE5_9PEZI|nr:peptidase S41 family protein ustP [Colletotrichum spaethianum]GKT49703.1 peptidase S41 family protein ustP [Colletotrichum spaethianum]
MQWDFENLMDTINSTYGMGFDVTGYGSRMNYTRPFGGPENIVLLYDGACASTCTLFSQFMKRDAGVKSIAMGGRPEIEDRIQGTGGVKGSQTYSFGSIHGYTQIAKRMTNDTSLIAELSRFTTYVHSRASSTSINVKDEILHENWEDGIPAQFITEKSDCRLYWQADMHQDMTNLWKAAATAAFKGGKCAFGAIDYSETATTKKRGSTQRPPFTRPRIQLRKEKGPTHAPLAKWDAEGSSLWTFRANHYMFAEN